MTQNSEPLVMWVVYENTKDHPGLFVARRWETSAGKTVATDDLVTARTLAEVRSKLPAGLYPIARAESDDPVIVESWI